MNIKLQDEKGYTLHELETPDIGSPTEASRKAIHYEGDFFVFTKTDRGGGSLLYTRTEVYDLAFRLTPRRG